jgi:hypothetical protein
MAQARVGVRVADDRKSVTIEIGPVEGPSSPVELDLEQLTKVINLLGKARGFMLDGSRVEPLDGKTVETVGNPVWYAQVAQIDGSLLAFEHPSYGPVAFAIPRSDVAEIVRILSAHLALPTFNQSNQAETRGSPLRTVDLSVTKADRNQSRGRLPTPSAAVYCVRDVLASGPASASL